MIVDVRKPIVPGLGTGIYTISEAARFLGVSTRKARGWADGYCHVRSDGAHVSEPVLERDELDRSLLTFHELIELFFVRELVKAGVPLPDIRHAAARLRDEWGTPYPVARDRLFTDGRQILVESGEHYRNVVRRQQVFAFAEQFFKDMDLDDELMAARWWALGRDRLVVLDPDRSFGAPIDIRSGIRTDIIYGAYKTDQDVNAVVQWYEITEEAVRDAIEFEERWLKAA